MDVVGSITYSEHLGRDLETVQFYHIIRVMILFLKEILDRVWQTYVKVPDSKYF